MDDSAARDRQRLALGALQSLAAFMWLSWCVDIRLPASTPFSDWLRPSPDVAILLAVLALFAPTASWRPGKSLIWSACALLLAVRCARIANGVCERFLDRQFHLVSDLALLPEFARLARSTLGPLRLGLCVIAFVAACALVWAISAAALRLLARHVSGPRVGNVYLGVVAVLALIGDLHTSVFMPATSPRLVRELELWLTARGLYDDPAHASQRSAFAERWQRRQGELARAAGPLDRLGRQDVHVILVEAYGHAVQATPAYRDYLAPDYARLSAALESAGFSVCTDFVRATVFGGNSWLTHATLETAVPFGDQFDYSLLLERPAVFSLAKAFHRAGYAAISIKPGTTRATPETRMYGFDREYAAKDFGYRGPRFSWSPMPDQFVLQRVAERELNVAGPPRFLEYALVSTHFPFTPHPTYVEDWTSLGDGSIFQQLPARNITRDADGMSAIQLAYLSSFRYELRVLGEYITRYIRGDALVILLGDHQPIRPVAVDPSRSTPMHVLSRRAALLEPFRARGCVPGLFSQRLEPHRNMEDLALDLLHDYSSPGAHP